MNRRHCPHCNCSTNIRYGTTSKGKERYLCKNCGKTWTHKSRHRLDAEIFHTFVWEQASIKVLATRYNLSPNKIRSIIHNYQPPEMDISQLSPEVKANIKVIMMDATYLHSHSHCVIVAIDAHNGRLLYLKEVDRPETVGDYYTAINALQKAGIYPKACVIDGRNGVKKMLAEEGIYTQYCLFHVYLLMKKYLTSKPVLEPNIQLKWIIEMLCAGRYNAESFQATYFSWRAHHTAWLNERTPSNDRKCGYEFTHAETRRLVRFIDSNYLWFFTYERHPELNIPKTSSRLEGKFGVAKTKLHVHRGYKNELRIKILFNLLSGDTGVENNT